MSSFLVIDYLDSLADRKPTVYIDAIPGEQRQSTCTPTSQSLVMPIDFWVNQSPGRLQVILSFNDERGFDVQLGRPSASAPSLPAVSSASSFSESQASHAGQVFTSLHNLPDVQYGESASSPNSRSLETATQVPKAPSLATYYKPVSSASATRGIEKKKKIACPLCAKTFVSKAARTIHFRSHADSILRQSLRALE